jgi:NADPH:quinone reductase-like Zn-dependent oxidoreductase
MKAFGLADEGAAAAVIEVPTPEPGPGEVRVKVRASSVNGFDVFVAKGMARGMMEHRYPVVIGKDHAGGIDALGEGVTGFAVGDEVTGIVPTEPHLWRGAYAEFVTVPLDGFIVHKPGNLDFERAACLGLAALTAFHCVETVEASEGNVELVVGATGGVGSYAVQLAAARGAKVVASALPQDEAWIRGLGADEIVDYSGDVVAAMLGRYPGGVDGLIVAAHVGDGFGALTDLVKKGGRIASTVGGADVEALAQRGVVATNVVGHADPETFARVVQMAADGMLSVPITRSFAFDELPQALRLVGEESSRGKFAIKISP